MRGGQIVEAGQADDIFERPRHLYTKTLVAAVPKTLRDAEREVYVERQHGATTVADDVSV